MAVVTLEDLQGTLEVVVFPRTYEQTLGQWREGAILLVAGRVDHRGEEASLLADAVWDWDAVADAGRRRSRARSARSTGGAAGVAAGRAARAATGNGNGNGGGERRRVGTAVAAGTGRRAPAVPPGRRRPRRRVRVVADARRTGRRPAADRARRSPIATYAEPPDLASAVAGGGADERRGAAAPRRGSAPSPRRPPRRRQRARRGLARRGAQRPVRARRRARTASCRRCRRSRPCSASGPAATRVVVHVPAPGGSALPMELRASPTTPSCWPRCAAGSATGSSTSARLTLATLRCPRREFDDDAARNDAAAVGGGCGERAQTASVVGLGRRRPGRACSSRRPGRRPRARCP